MSRGIGAGSWRQICEGTKLGLGWCADDAGAGDGKLCGFLFWAENRPDFGELKKLLKKDHDHLVPVKGVSTFRELFVFFYNLGHYLRLIIDQLEEINKGANWMATTRFPLLDLP